MATRWHLKSREHVGFNEAATDSSRKSRHWIVGLPMLTRFNEAATDSSRKCERIADAPGAIESLQ